MSAFFALLAVKLCVLWVRSYWWNDLLVHQGDRFAEIGSCHGAICAIYHDLHMGRAGVDDWVYVNVPAHRMPPGFYWYMSSNQISVTVPHWFPILICSGLAAISWVSQLFSLRTLVIATTLVAVVLGLAVWAGK